MRVEGRGLIVKRVGDMVHGRWLRVYSCWSMVEGLGFWFRVEDEGLGVEGLGLWLEGIGLRVEV